MRITLEMAAILLAIVSFVVTVFGFFASLIFYRDGKRSQKEADDTLSKIAEKTDSIQAQVVGILNRTLDAALGKSNELETDFEKLERQLSETKEVLLTQARDQIGEAGEQQRRRIRQAVEEQIKLLEDRVESTRVKAEDVADFPVELVDQLLFSTTVPEERPTTVARYLIDKLPPNTLLADSAGQEIARMLMREEKPDAIRRLCEETKLDEDTARKILTKVNVLRFKDALLRS